MFGSARSRVAFCPLFTRSCEAAEGLHPNLGVRPGLNAGDLSGGEAVSHAATYNLEKL